MLRPSPSLFDVGFLRGAGGLRSVVAATVEKLGFIYCHCLSQAFSLFPPAPSQLPFSPLHIFIGRAPALVFAK